jgi:hypothetical protein
MYSAVTGLTASYRLDVGLQRAPRLLVRGVPAGRAHGEAARAEQQQRRRDEARQLGAGRHHVGAVARLPQALRGQDAVSPSELSASPSELSASPSELSASPSEL